MYPIQSVLIYLIMYAIIHYMLWVQKKICIPGKNQKSIFSHFLALELFPTNRIFDIMKIKDS